MSSSFTESMLIAFILAVILLIMAILRIRRSLSQSKNSSDPTVIKKSVAVLLLGIWNAKAITSILIGGMLYGILLIYGPASRAMNIPVYIMNIIPLLIAVLFGPLPAGLTAVMGTFIAALIDSSSTSPIALLLSFSTSFFVGLYVFSSSISTGIFTKQHAALYCLWAVLIPTIVFPLNILLIFPDSISDILRLSLFGIVPESISFLLIGLPALIVLADHYKKRMEQPVK